MAHLDAATRQRLEALRATDTTGVYASDEQTEGSDATGAMAVTVDPTLRVTCVEVRSLEPLRTPTALRQAFEAAYRDALARRLRRDDHAPDDRQRERPVARRVRRISAAPTPELVNRHQIRYRERGTSAAGQRGLVVGTSTNGCVTVVLPPANPRGVLDSDPGWLATTTGARLSAAITEAFAEAYARRDQS